MFYFNAYQELATCRNHEGGRIPWTAINQYAKFYRLSVDEAEDLLSIITMLDVMVLADEADNGKSDKPKPVSGKGRKDKASD